MQDYPSEYLQQLLEIVMSLAIDVSAAGFKNLIVY